MYYNEGNRYYDALGYGKAIESYQKALSRKDIVDAKRKLAYSYKKLGNYKKAEEWLAKVVTDPSVTAEDKIAYGQLLVINGKCTQAVEYLQNNLPENPQAKLFIESCNAQPALMADSALYLVEEVSLNTRGSDFSPLYYNKGLLFVSEGTSNEKKPVSEYTGRAYLDLYYVEFDDNKNFSVPVPLKGEINSKYHEGPAAFSADGNTIYFTRNNYLNKKSKKDDAGVVNLKIYKAGLINDEWKNIESLSFNNDDYSTGHPTLSSDGNTMYFISDMPGGYGETDIYVSRLENNIWSKPENLGLDINTPGKEMFPYLQGDTMLYFSSDGKAGMGGMDIYYSQLQNGKWSKPANAGFPVNSSSDDFGFIADSTGTTGYLSSNRSNDNGIDKIFKFTKVKPLINLDGLVVDKETKSALPGALVELLNLVTGETQTKIVGEDGIFDFDLSADSEYKLSVSKDNYFTVVRNIDTKGKTNGENIYERIELEKIIIDKPIVLENIYYDFDKWNIRPDAALELDKFVTFLLDNPKIRVELSSHTDSRGTDKYNLNLSQKRAESAVQYLISKGIPAERITAMGYGETMLVNRCGNNVRCSEADHQQNRRTEFKVTGYMAGGTEIVTASISSPDAIIKNSEHNVSSITNTNKADVFFTVQIGAVLKEKAGDASKFEKVKNVWKEEGNDNYLRFFVGKAKSFSEAQTIRNDLVGKGFNDAFITAFHKNDKISVREAQEILRK